MMGLSLVLGLAGRVFADPGVRRVAVVFGLIAVVALGFYLAGREDGAENVTSNVNAQNEIAEDTALSAERDVAACIGAGRWWDVTTGTCR